MQLSDEFFDSFEPEFRDRHVVAVLAVVRDKSPQARAHLFPRRFGFHCREAPRSHRQVPGVNEFLRRIRAAFEAMYHIFDFFLRAIVRRVEHFASQIKNARAHGTRAFDLALPLLYELPGAPSTANPKTASGGASILSPPGISNSVECAASAGSVIQPVGKNSGVIHRMNDDTEKSSASSAIVLAIIVIGVAIYCAAYGLQTLAWYEGHHWGERKSVARGRSAAIGGCTARRRQRKPRQSFQLRIHCSLDGQDHADSFANGRHVIRFDSGEAIFFYDPETLLDSLRQMKSASPLQYQKFVNLFVDHPIESNYGLYEAVYGAAPSQLSPIMMSRDALRMNELLIWKLGFGIDLRGGRSSFTRGPNRGFQFGDPAKGPVALRVFSDRKEQFRFIFVVTPNASGKITQNDIAGIIASFKPVPILER